MTLIYCNKINKQLGLMLLLFLTIMSSGCQLLNVGSAKVPLGDDTFYQLQAVPNDFNGRISLQKLTVTTTDSKHELLVQTELHQQQINMVGFSQSGLQLFELSWQPQGNIELSSNILLPNIPAEQLLAYYQLSNWPLPAVINGLKGIQVKGSENNNVRKFYIEKTLVVTIKQSPQQSVMIHHRDNYQIDIENID